MRWAVICNGAKWQGSFPSLAAALRAVGEIANRTGNDETHNWVIEIVRVQEE